jgi:hypothetical protein
MPGSERPQPHQTQNPGMAVGARLSTANTRAVDPNLAIRKRADRLTPPPPAAFSTISQACASLYGTTGIPPSGGNRGGNRDSLDSVHTTWHFRPQETENKILRLTGP